MFLPSHMPAAVNAARWMTYSKNSRHIHPDSLIHVRGQPFETAVWLNVAIGLRVGEIQALTWENVDLDQGLVHIRSTYVRKEGRFQDYPKGRQWHSVKMPPELWEILRQERLRSSGSFVIGSPRKTDFMDYGSYYKALRRYCREAGIRVIATHGLRHSTSGIYIQHGASRDDLQKLFAHSSSQVTERYIHERSNQLEQVANIVRLFPPAKKDVKPEPVPVTGRM